MLGFHLGGNSGLAGKSNHRWDLPDFPEAVRKQSCRSMTCKNDTSKKSM